MSYEYTFLVEIAQTTGIESQLEASALKGVVLPLYQNLGENLARQIDALPQGGDWEAISHSTVAIGACLVTSIMLRRSA